MRTPSAATDDVAAACRRRAERAAELAPRAPSAEEPLRFVAGLFRTLAEVAAAFAGARAAASLSGSLPEDLALVLPATRVVLDYAAATAPEPLAAAARALLHEDVDRAGARLRAYFDGEHDAAEDYLARARLRPYVATLVALGRAPRRPRPPRGCPRCGGAPIVAKRRAAAPGEGAQRFFDCGLCGGEWEGGRLSCPGCGNDEPTALASLQTASYPGVRLETCERCHAYVKSIDLELDARPLPEIDDLVSIATDLRAQEDGYRRLEIGWAGV